MRPIAALLRHRGVPVHDIAPVRVARRAALLDLGVADRAFGYPLELLLRAGAAGWRISEFPVRLPRARRGPVEGLRLGARHAPGDPGHGRAAAVTAPALGLLVLAKAPEPGRVKTRLCPPPTPAEAADLAAAALLDTLDAACAVPGGAGGRRAGGRMSGRRSWAPSSPSRCAVA